MEQSAAFDRLAELASRTLATPVSVLTRIDADGQVFVGQHGLGDVRGTPLSDSFCRHVVERGEPLLVEDSRQDPLVSSSSAIDDLGFVSYAGVPLLSESGQAVGAFCVVDPHPRVWTEDEVQALRDLAAAAMSEVERSALAQTAEATHGRLRAVVDSSLDCVVTMDRRGNVVDWNPAAERTFGYTRDAAVGRPVSELIVPASQRGLHEHAMRSHDPRIESTVVGRRRELTAVRADGSELPVELAVVRTESGGEPLFVGFIRDLSELRRSQEDLRSRETQLSAIAESAPMVLFATDRDGRITVATGSGLASLGLTPEDRIGASLVDDLPQHAANARRALAGESVTAPIERDGTAWDVSYRPTIDADGSVAGLVAVATDVTARVRGEREIAHWALHDRLTGLPNRMGLEQRLAESLARSRRSGQAGALVNLGLDGFKLVNDTLGHQAGDAVLREVGRRLDGAVRATDLTARVGGDGFAVLLEDLDCDPRVAAETVAAKLLAALRGEITIADTPFEITASAGIAVWPEDGRFGDELLQRAEAAMYQAKRAGAGQIAAHTAVVAEPGYGRTRLTLPGRLRKAIDGGELRLHYQPIVNLETDAIAGFEALVRWQDPEHGLRAPDVFLPVAEETGLIDALGEWVAGEASRQLAEWAARGHLTRMSFNAAPRELARAGFADRLLATARREGIDPSRLIVEITESGAMGSPEAVEPLLRRLHDEGFLVAIDDFGAGQSSLNRLGELAVSGLKMDRRFLRDVPADPRATALVRAILALAGALGLSVVAEGVETADQRAFLLDAGCPLGQGFGLWRPMPAEAATDLLAVASIEDVGEAPMRGLAAR